jgi:glycosyltransferase involved in cell wall biosynthesis
VPVLTSNSSSMPEVGGADSAYYVDPESVDQIAQGMRAVLLNPSLSQSLVARGYENAKRFNWDKSALQLNEIVERVMGEK